MASGTDGNIISYDTSGNPVAVATGSSGQVLTSAGAGAVPSFQASAVGGKVLQVINVTINTETTVNNNTWTDTGLTASITPSATSSKVLIFASCQGVGKASSNTYAMLKLLRGSTDIVADFETRGGFNNDTNPNKIGGCSVNYLDAPSSTSAVAYKVQLRSGNNSSYAQMGDSNSKSTITLMEIAG